MYTVDGTTYVLKHCKLVHTNTGQVEIACHKHRQSQLEDAKKFKEGMCIMPECCAADYTNCAFCKTQILEGSYYRRVSDYGTELVESCGLCAMTGKPSKDKKTENIFVKKGLAARYPFYIIFNELPGTFNDFFHYLMYDCRKMEPFESEVEDLPSEVKKKLYDTDPTEQPPKVYSYKPEIYAKFAARKRKVVTSYSISVLWNYDMMAQLSFKEVVAAKIEANKVLSEPFFEGLNLSNFIDSELPQKKKVQLGFYLVRSIKNSTRHLEQLNFSEIFQISTKKEKPDKYT